MSRIFGGPFDSTVKTALQARQNLLNKNYRDDKELIFLNSNHSWVKVTSCVNLTEGGDQLAKDNVLMGGTLYDKTVRQGFRPGQEESSYEFNTEFGFVPMPGIDGISVETKNVYGSLKAASVEFKTNSPEQLTKLEKLFLRPGFSILLEWGNTHYLDNDTISEVKTIEEGVSFGSDIQAVYDKINTLRKESQYNYDALFGVIKNFQWAYAENGEYDCKVDIIGRGELIESLQTLFFSGTKIEDAKKEGDRSQVGTALQQFLMDINNFYKEGEFKGEGSKKIVNQIKKNLDITELDIHTHSVDSQPPNNRYFYMPFSHILEAMNVCLMLKYEEGKPPVVSFNSKKTQGKGQPFVTYDEHRVIDPAVGFIPNDSCFKFQKKGSADSILDIYINIKLVLDILEDFEKSNNSENTTVLQLIKKILASLQTNAGNINDFDVHFDDDDRKYYIVDRDKTPDPKELLELQAIGKGSTFLDIRFSSKLSSRISSMIAISARVGNTDAGEQLLGMQKWNEGLEDRFLKEKYIFEVEETEDSKTERKDSIAEYINDIEKGDDTYIESNSKIKMISHNISEANSAIREIDKEEGIPGLVPLELVITLKGISGLKVGQGFLLDETILPGAYRGRVGFIITGVAHTFDNNTWQTELNSQTFMIG